jgi:hypothetical protein
MKILAKFLLPGVFVFFFGVPVWAQVSSLTNCQHGLFWDQDEQSVINDLVKRQDCLSAELQENGYLKTEIYDLQDKLEQTERDLHIAEVRIETLESRYQMLDLLLTPLPERRPANKPKAPVNNPTPGKPKAPANKPTVPVSKPTPAVKEGTH